MYHYSTLSDKHYLVLGLTLYESLLRHCKQDFMLHYLALDDETYDILTTIDNPNIVVYRIDDIRNEEYNTLEKNNKNDPNGISPFHYMMCSFFNYYLFTELKLPHILYIDADICFYNNASHAITCCNNYDMGFIAHKHVPRLGEHVGFFNVGIIFFRNSEIGLQCLEWWKNIGLDPNNEWAKQYGSCGDQKYLELFWTTFGPKHIKLIDSDIGHSAPWNITRSEIHNGLITWDSSFVFSEPYKTQLLYFNHFSHFKPQFDQDSYKTDWNGEWGGFLNNPGAPELYDNYYQLCKQTKEKYGL